jgi:hypothetical protein
MTKGEMFASLKHMSTEDQRTFDRWLRTNMVIASIIGAGLVAMALAGAGADPEAIGPRSAIADVGPVATPLSPYELMLRLPPDALPVEQVAEPF